MTDSISLYRGINPKPVRQITWPQALEDIRAGVYREQVEQAREIKDPEKYREFKKNLPAVTFSGTFNGRRANDSVLSTTGLIIQDLDHLEDVDRTFRLLCADEKILFAFRSPGGDGIKSGIRAEGINSDTDHKRLYTAVERYFHEVYGITIDPACKDISRLTFLSYDPDLWVRSDAVPFDIGAWSAPTTPVDTVRPQYVLDTKDELRGQQLYARKVLESCCRGIAESAPGQQHVVRLTKARLIGGYMHLGLAETEVLSELEKAVVMSGAKNIQSAMKTIRDGLAHGQERPIPLPDNSDKSDKSDKSDNQDKEDRFGQIRTKSDKIGQNRTDRTVERDRFEGNLTSEIRAYVSENQGTFTVADIDREFGLTHRQDRKNRSAVLSLLQLESYIKKDRRAAGKFHIIQQDIEWIDIENVDETYFPIQIPLGLSTMVNLPPKCICVLAGTSNAGKTAFLLELLRINQKANFEKLYLMSEMGPSEYRGRVSRLTTDIKSWKKDIRAAPVSSGFDGPVAQYNPDGLSVVDFLEEVEGEYYRIASDIRSIYDALGTGVAWIALQKHTQASVGRGGEGTTEKARLYLTIDTLTHQPNCTISALKIIKAKDYNGPNPNGKELHVRITGGALIERIPQFGDWQYCNPVQRQKWVTQYEHMLARGLDTSATPGREAIAKFLCQDGQHRFINRHNCDEWQKAFEHINVEKELEGLSRWAEKNPLKVDYFQQLCGILVNSNNKAAEKNGRAPF